MGKRERICNEVVSEMLKRKVNEDVQDLNNLKRRRLVNSQNSNDPCPTCSASCSSSNASTGNSIQKLSTLDLQEESSDEVEMETTATFNVEETERKEATPFCKMESTTAPPSTTSSCNRSTGAKTPSDAELEEFFSAVVKDIHKQFSKKYNFDIVKEEPLEGRYEWVQLKK